MSSSTTIDYQALYEASERRSAELEFKVMELTHQLQKLQKMIFGSRSERFVPERAGSVQPVLFEVETEGESCQVTGAKQVAYIKTQVSKAPDPLNHPGRMKLPDHLRRERIILEPCQQVSGCKKIGEQITEELEYKPGELYVNQYIRPKYSCPVPGEDTATRIIIAELPTRPIDKCIAGPGLLAQIIIDKYVDHLPLNRQMERFSRGGVNLPITTITGWVSSVCHLIEPLEKALTEQVLQAGYLHADETPIKVLDKDKKGKSHKGWFWVYHDSIDKLVFFDYQPGRGRAGPENILKGFLGYIQSDGYDAYDHFDEKQGITQLHCMAHARRKFDEAKDNDKARAEYALGQIKLLYDIERECKEMGYDERKQIRVEKAVPILEELGKWMTWEYEQAPALKSAIKEALAYSIKRWDKLSRYTTDGKLNIDNNPVERSIRPVAIGRKNYLFCGSHEAAKRAAMLYSLMGTCKLHGINPYEWLKDVLMRIPDHPINRINELLPHNWNKQRAEPSVI